MTVESIHVGPTGYPEPSPFCIEALEGLLEKARSGHIVGIAYSAVCYDGQTEWSIAGHVGGHAMLGAHECARAELAEIVRGG